MVISHPILGILRTYIRISIVRIPYKTWDEFHPDFFHIGYTLIKWFCITVNVGIFIYIYIYTWYTLSWSYGILGVPLGKGKIDSDSFLDLQDFRMAKPDPPWPVTQWFGFNKSWPFQRLGKRWWIEIWGKSNPGYGPAGRSWLFCSIKDMNCIHPGVLPVLSNWVMTYNPL